MTQAICKFELNENQQDISVPENAKILSIQTLNDQTTIWIEVDTSLRKKHKKRITKHFLEIDCSQTLALPEDAEIILADTEKNKPFIWVASDKAITNTIDRKLGLIPTGQSIYSQSHKYYGTVMFNKGQFIQHLYEFYDNNSAPDPHAHDTKRTSSFRNQLFDKIDQYTAQA